MGKKTELERLHTKLEYWQVLRQERIEKIDTRIAEIQAEIDTLESRGQRAAE